MKRRNLILTLLLVPAAMLLVAMLLAALLLPPVLERRLASLLSQYGVRDYSYSGLVLLPSGVAAREVTLLGEREGLRFAIGARSLELSWDWRELFDGRLRALRLRQLDLGMEAQAPRAVATPGAIELAALLPRPLLVDRPVDSVHVEQLQLEYRPGNREPLRAEGSLSLDATAYLVLHSRQRETDLQLETTVTPGGPDLDVKATATGPGGDLGRLAATLDASSPGGWHWRIEGNLAAAPLLEMMRGLGPTSPGAFTLGDLDVRGELEFAAQFQHADRVEQPLTDVAGWLLTQRGQLQLGGSLERLDHVGTVADLQGSFELRAATDRGDWRVGLDNAEFTGSLPAERLGLSAAARQWLGYDQQVPVRLELPQGLALAPDQQGRWRLQLENGGIRIGTRDSELRLQRIEVDGRFDAGQADLAQLSLSSRIDSRLRRRMLPPLALSLEQAGGLAESRYTLKLRDVAESMQLQLDGDGNLLTGAGRGTLGVKVTDLAYAASTVLPLLARFDLFEEDLEFTGGRASLDSRFVSGGYALDGLEQTVTLAFDGIAGRYDEYRFTGLGLDAEWTGARQLASTRPLSLSLASLELGFDLTDIEATALIPRLSLVDPPVVQLESFSAGVFGGRLFLPEPVRWDFGADGNRFTLQARDWQLAQLVTLQSGQQIEAAGVLEGRLPVEFGGGRMVIEEGSLRSVPPGGTIRYVADEASRTLADSSSELALALDMLEDFRFKVLSAEVRLDREGQLWLGLSLAGSNPSQFGGRAVNFNINLEQNLDPLLQSLRLSDKLVEDLERRLK